MSDANVSSRKWAGSVAATRTHSDAVEEPTKKPKKEIDPKKRRRRRIIAIVVAAVLVILLGVLIWLLVIGAIAPWYVAAKYYGMHYITESEVSDYVESYQIQQGYEDATDEDWAIYLAAYDLTPETLRASVIQQLVTTDMIEIRAKENGVELSDEEWEYYRANIVDNLAFGDEDIYQETIEAQGQTVEEYEDSYRNLLLREKLYEAVVEVPEATDEETLSYIASTYTEETKAKHIYYFYLPYDDPDDTDGDGQAGTYEERVEVQEIQDELIEEGLSAENFEIMVGGYSEDDDLIETGGAYGWDLDIEDYSSEFQDEVDKTKVGEVSEVFGDEDGYAFVYIDTKFVIPAYDADDPYTLDDFPESLQDWFADCASLDLWDDDCNEYLGTLYEESNCLIYDMPESVPYNVDMDLAVEYAEEQMYAEEEGETTSDETYAEEDGDSVGDG